MIWFLYGGDAHGIGVPLLAHMAGVHMHTRGARASLVVQRAGSEQACLIDGRGSVGLVGRPVS